jgi:hypothetical protein
MTDKTLAWRTSRFSTNGACVQVAGVTGHTVAVRNSNRPDAGDPRPASVFSSLIDGVRAGMMDDLT